ncbi:hypothetical protein FDB42_12065 [Clostridium botulinum]|uniref:hypothetical protein n=1 Tax=Clostridium botulinum TaxID=1491 RepID=UPI001400B026|nr:hypothetical protein [Clostridium botulinum]MBN1058494.1 hypothetical protein [Clostridium botulinum]NFO40818.1 hypothetical protein [Clostridium botulinum]
MGYTRGIKWTAEKIKTEIKEVMKTLNIDRMPTSVEIKKVTRNTSLINAIRRHGGYLFWAMQMNITQNECTTRTGLDGELLIKEILEYKGYSVEKMSVKHPYDLLVNENIKIDVKVSHKYKGKFGEYYTFNLEKANPTCDIYVFICAEEDKKKFLIIPSKFLHQTQISVGYNSKYDIYKDSWDYIEQYNEFYKNVI